MFNITQLVVAYMGWSDTNLNFDPSVVASSGLIGWGSNEDILLLDDGLPSCNSFYYDYFATVVAFIFAPLEIERLNV